MSLGVFKYTQWKCVVIFNWLLTLILNSLCEVLRVIYIFSYIEVLNSWVICDYIHILLLRKSIKENRKTSEIHSNHTSLNSIKGAECIYDKKFVRHQVGENLIWKGKYNGSSGRKRGWVCASNVKDSHTTNCTTPYRLKKPVRFRILGKAFIS